MVRSGLAVSEESRRKGVRVAIPHVITRTGTDTPITSAPPVRPEPHYRRAFLVVLEDGLHVSRAVGIVHNIAQLPGVRCVVDLACVDQPTLEVMLRMPEPKESSA